MGIVTEEMLTERKHLIRMMDSKKETKKNKVKEIRPLDRILHRRDGRRTQYYFTCGRKIDASSRDEDSLKDVGSRVASSSWRKSGTEKSPKEDGPDGSDGDAGSGHTDMVKRLQTLGGREKRRSADDRRRIERPRSEAKNYMKPTYKWKIKGNVLERLRIPEEDHQFRQIIHYDPDFFTTWKDVEKVRFRKREYRDEKRKTFRSNLISAYLSDEMALARQIDVLHEKEIAESEYNLKIAQDCLLTFLMERSDDADRMRDHLSQTIVRIQKENKNIEKLEKLAKTIQMKIYGEDKKVTDLQRWKKFFYEVSPDSWKKEFDRDCSRMSCEHAEKIKMLEDDLKSFEMYSGGNSYQLRNCVDNTVNIMRTFGSELFYFDNSRQITDILRRMQQKSIRVIQHHGDILMEKEQVENCLTSSLVAQNDRLVAMEREVEEMKARSQRIREQCEETKESFYKTTEGPLKDILTDRGDLTVKALVRDLYEELIGSGEGVSYIDMLRDIEWRMLEMWRRIEAAPRETVKKISARVRNRRNRQMAAAVDARKRSTEIGWMLKGLERAYECPLGPRTFKFVYPRSPEIVRSKRAESDLAPVAKDGIHSQYLIDMFTVDATPTPEQSSPSLLPFESTSSV